MRTFAVIASLLVFSIPAAAAEPNPAFRLPDLNALIFSLLSQDLYFGPDDVLKCKDPDSTICVIKSNFGGKVWKFQRAAYDVATGAKTLVVIDGECASACGIAADQAREKFCITPKAYFLFHKAFDEQKVWTAGIQTTLKSNFTDPPQSEEINRWVRAKHPGGYPKDGFVIMTNREAAVFWHQCELNPPLPKPRPATAPRLSAKRTAFNAHGLY